MPRGRHRHSPPLHRLLPPSAIAGVSVVCALGPWASSEATVLRALAAAAAATTVVGAVVMRRWDAQAGKRVADLTRARAGDEWRFEERIAELETDLEESRELRAKLEQRLRAKRAELAGLRNEHAALLRRYATAETERASALEGRRLLEIESAVPSGSLALPAARSAEPGPPGAPAPGAARADAGDVPGRAAVFSSEGSRLFRRAGAALARLDPEASAVRPPAAGPGPGPVRPGGPSRAGSEAGGPAKGAGAGADVTGAGEASRSAGAAQEDEAQGKSGAAGAHARASAAPTVPAESAPTQGQQPAGHFAVPTAVAVVPAAPARRTSVEGGFDFFGTQKHTSSAALDSVQNEDLADVVGQEALALHKAEAEAEFKPADEEARGIGQVIDLTAHDETEHIDVHRLRSAAS
ncbi:hypothetical protein QQY24_13830 [Streptomyces sp. TG1A-8]|uniref:hypothetical protein n=1 Tax=Streptomyces sp. TG1A-8 TaxID=3051385 RepID=UPI00265BA264|nr:hypothetical protein [Streptomyces sp. TG1A-8]MDO0926445.1 hypothetical protein [Streptomyces sp. TG1A-8]